MRNLILRAITGTLFVTLLVFCILFSPLTFGFLFAVITAFAINEFGVLVNMREGIHVNRLLNAFSGVYLFLAFFTLFCLQAGDLSIFIPYLLLLLYMFIRELYIKGSDALGNWAYSVLSQLYIALPFGLLCVMSSLTMGMYEMYNPILPLAVFVFIWCNDTGAYCVGCLIGKHRLFERISPKKSWEGSAGGAVFALAAAWAMSHFFVFLNVWQWLGMAAVIVVFGTWGDLVESLIKRQLGLKDSGNFLPGHGGLLDRFDSTLLAVPAALLYLYIILSL